MAKTILYTRVSTARQAIEGESLGAQLAKLQSWAQREEHEVIATFTDEGVSGASLIRPGSQAALNMAVRTKAQIAVTTLARWGRSTAEVISSCEQLARAGAGFVSLSEQFSLGHSSGRLVLAVLAAVSCWQMEVQQEQTVMTLSHLRRIGRRISGVPPYGWRFDAAGERLIEVEVEQVVLTEMQRLRASGMSFDRCALNLNNTLRVPSKLGGRWSGRSVRLTLARLAKLSAA